jgi:hypothetical protein
MILTVHPSTQITGAAERFPFGRPVIGRSLLVAANGARPALE